MNSKQKRTLSAVFADPVSPSIRWSDIESLLAAVGCKLVEGSGSRVRFERDGMIATFHRPHPKPESLRYQVREAREYLMRLGVVP
jgi:hypothetical protein